jgi:6-phosphogluconolactonase
MGAAGRSKKEMSWTLYQYTDNSDLIRELAPRISSLLRQVIARQGRASIAVSGGKSPAPLFDALSMEDIPWSLVIVTLVDERWVDENHPASNARLVREHLLQNRAALAQFVGLKSAHEDPFDASVEVQMRLLKQVMPLDLVILGMGEDGHTASFLPGATGLTEALAPDSQCMSCAIRPPEGLPRMTMSLPVLLSAGSRILYIVGKERYPMLVKAMQAGAAAEVPVRAVLHQPQHPIDIYYAENAGENQ